MYWASQFYDAPILASKYESRKDELAESVPGELELDDDEWIRKMRLSFPDDDETAYEEPPVDETTEGYERIPIPWFVKRRVMRHLIKEAHAYLFNANGMRDTIRDMVIEDLNSVPAGTRHVLVGHSQGSFIAYDVLTGDPRCKEVDGLLTLGSPLGVDEIQDKLVWTRQNGFPGKLRGDWVNVYDPFDLISRLDPTIANDFRRNGDEVVIDVAQENWGTWRHSASKYLKGSKLRQHLRRLCNREDA